MPELLNQGAPIQTQDDYVKQLTLGPSAGVRQVNLAVLSVASCTVQCWRYADDVAGDVELEPQERVIPGQSPNVVFRNCAGIQIRSTTPGSPATVQAELAYAGDVDVDRGTITSATIGPTGAVS